MAEKMNERKKKILRAITDDYISTGEPVGSRTIAKKYQLGLSPATIRNEMADLEEGGYLEQPHTSAGRIPSDQGYRYYVDALMGQRPLTKQEIEKIRSEYESKKQEFDSVMKQTSKVLTQITSLPAFSMTPEISPSRFRHIQLVPISSESILMVIVTDSGNIEHRTLTTSEHLDTEILEKLSTALNCSLRGRYIHEVNLDALKNIKAELILHEHFFDQVMKLLGESFLQKQKERIFLEGASHILEQPEFNSIDKVKPLLQLFEEEEKLYTIVTGEKVKGEKIKIRIGKENQSSASLSDCSIITAVYDIGGQSYGKIGILGPKRMDYSHMVAVVDFISRYLSEMIKNI